MIQKTFGTPAGWDGSFANLNESLWRHKDLQLSLPTTESLNHSGRGRQREHRRLSEPVTSSPILVLNHCTSGLGSVSGLCEAEEERGCPQGMAR